MRLRKLLLCVFSLVFVFAACTISKQSAHVIVNNESKENVPMKLVISDHENGKTRKEIDYLLKPGLQEVQIYKFPKGAYDISLNLKNGVIHKNYPLALDTDRWIMVTYMQDDSLRLQKKYGYIDTSSLKKINGQFAGLNLYVENRRPPNL